MSRVRTVALSLMLLVVMCCCASPAGADPLRVRSGIVDAGFGFLTQPLIAEELALIGTNFEIQSSLEDEDAAVQLVAPATLAPGALADFSGLLVVRGDQLGMKFGDSLGLLKTPFMMSFNASPMFLVCSGTGSSTRCTGSAPFTFHTMLAFTPFGGDPVMHVFTGGGTVEATVTRVNSLPYGAVRYVFESSPIPELSTLSLCTTGAIIIAGAAVSSRRRVLYRSPRGRIALAGTYHV
jgi:hypothetical protein